MYKKIIKNISIAQKCMTERKIEMKDRYKNKNREREKALFHRRQFIDDT